MDLKNKHCLVYDLGLFTENALRLVRDCASGTGFLKSTYTDSSGTVVNTNPVILDANGEADVWLSG